MDKIIVIKEYNKVILSYFRRCLKGDKFGMTMPKLNDTSFLVVNVGDDDEWRGLLHCLINGDVLIFSGYTNKEYRRRGISTKLRKYVIDKYEDIRRFESLTMEGSYSDVLLEKMGFIKEGNKMIYDVRTLIQRN